MGSESWSNIMAWSPRISSGTVHRPRQGHTSEARHLYAVPVRSTDVHRGRIGSKHHIPFYSHLTPTLPSLLPGRIPLGSWPDESRVRFHPRPSRSSRLLGTSPTMKSDDDACPSDRIKKKIQLWLNKLYQRYFQIHQLANYEVITLFWVFSFIQFERIIGSTCMQWYFPVPVSQISRLCTLRGWTSSKFPLQQKLPNWIFFFHLHILLSNIHIIVKVIKGRDKKRVIISDTSANLVKFTQHSFNINLTLKKKNTQPHNTY